MNVKELFDKIRDDPNITTDPINPIWRVTVIAPDNDELYVVNIHWNGDEQKLVLECEG